MEGRCGDGWVLVNGLCQGKKCNEKLLNTTSYFTTKDGYTGFGKEKERKERPHGVQTKERFPTTHNKGRESIELFLQAKAIIAAATPAATKTEAPFLPAAAGLLVVVGAAVVVAAAVAVVVGVVPLVKPRRRARGAI